MPTPSPRSVPITHKFADDGTIPNNPVLPLVMYRAGIDLAGSPDPEAIVEKTFATNGWGGMWRNGVYPYVHYHSMIHEAMGIARGRARVRFGGEHGREIDLAPGDVVVLPAGTGHQGLSHTPGPRRDRQPIRRSAPTISAAAAGRNTRPRSNSIPRVPLPETDPVFGAEGPLIALWRS